MTSHEKNHAAGPEGCQPNGVRDVIRFSFTSDFSGGERYIDMDAINQMSLDERVKAINFLLSIATDIRDFSTGTGLNFMEILDDGRGWKIQPTTGTVEQLIKHYRQNQAG